jgi:hypothetical protein
MRFLESVAGYRNTDAEEARIIYARIIKIYNIE